MLHEEHTAAALIFLTGEHNIIQVHGKLFVTATHAPKGHSHLTINL